MGRHALLSAVVAFACLSSTVGSGLRLNARGSLQHGIRSKATAAVKAKAKSTLMTPDGEPLEERHAFTVPLKKSQVDAKDQMQFLRQLKLLQLQMREIYASAEDESFIQESFVKLTQQVLPEKRLATYYGEITFGDPKNGKSETFPMLFDTGSCEFWVPSKGCKDRTNPPERCEKHHLYDPTKSSNYKKFGENKLMNIKYLSGAVEGPLATDTVNLGDTLSVTDQVFGMAQEVDVPLLDDVVWDGIIGLAYPNKELADQDILPLFDNIMQKKLLQNNIFSYYLGINGGAVTFGGVDTRYMGEDDSPSPQKQPAKKPAAPKAKKPKLAAAPAPAPAPEKAPEKAPASKPSEQKRFTAVATPATANPYEPQQQEADPIAAEMLGPSSGQQLPNMWNRGAPADSSIYGGGYPNSPDPNLPSEGPILASPVFLEESESSGEDVVMQNILDQEKAEAQAPRKFFNYAKVTDKGYWTIEIEDILLQYPGKEAESTGVCKDRENGRCTAIVDTGTYLIYGPQDQVNNQLGAVVVNSCEDIKKLPKIIYVMYAGDGVPSAHLTLHPHDYTLEFQVPKDEGGDGKDCNSPADADSEACQSDCVLGLGPDNDEGWTLGQVFLRSFYTVFDRDNDKIGFTRANPRAEVG